jgi:hypothetical protein
VDDEDVEAVIGVADAVSADKGDAKAASKDALAAAKAAKD